MQTFRTKLRQIKSALTSAGVFCGHGYESVDDESVALLLGSVGLPPDQRASLLDAPFPDVANTRLNELLDKRCQQRLPVAYCLGEAYLAGERFIADSRALVPRSPIAHLTRERLAPWWPEDALPNTIVDVCCGGGSLGLIAARMFPDAMILMSDFDHSALSLAVENIEAHSQSAQVRCLRADLLGALAPGSVDIVLANPPYVSAQEMAELPREYAHEPGMALEAEAEGTALAVRLLREASSVLSPRGLMVLEVGETASTLEEALPRVPFLWLDLPQGGSGVTAISAQELRDWSAAGVL